jgi:hypothetical protein
VARRDRAGIFAAGRTARRRPGRVAAVLAIVFPAMIVACGPPTISSAPEHIAARKPGHPITLTLLNGSGDLQVYQKI